MQVGVVCTRSRGGGGYGAGRAPFLVLSKEWLSGSSAGLATSLGEVISRYLGAPAPPAALTGRRLGTWGRGLGGVSAQPREAAQTSHTGRPRFGQLRGGNEKLAQESCGVRLLPRK